MRVFSILLLAFGALPSTVIPAKANLGEVQKDLNLVFRQASKFG